MKSIPWRLYFGFIMMTGILPGFAFGLAVYAGYKQSGLAIVAGSILGAFSVFDMPSKSYLYFIHGGSAFKSEPISLIFTKLPV